MVAWIPILSVCLGAFFISKRVDINKVAMRFFRDLSRSKARKRLYGNEHALMPIIFGKEEPLNISDHENESTVTMTREELASFRGQDGAPLYLSIQGRIYDVSANEKFYGENGNYHLFTGTDATRAFATACLLPECVESSTEGLSDAEMKEIQRWIELYETHDKYSFIGHLLDVDPVDAMLALDEEMEDDAQQDETERVAETS